MLLDPLLQPFIANIQDRFMIECHVRERSDTMPVELVVVDLQLVMLDIDERTVCDRYHPGGRMAAYFTEAPYLLQVNIIHTRTLLKDPVRGLPEVLVVMYQVAQQGPFIIELFEIGFDQQYLQLIIVKSKYYTIHGN